MSLSLRQLACALACLIALGGSLPTPALGAQAPSRWHTFTSANGLAGNIVQAIWEDQRGQIWFGTENGVSRYDGQRWMTFRAGPGLPDPNVWAVSGDAQATWFATSSGLSRYDGERWQAFTTADGLPADDVRAVLVAADGTVWAGTFGRGIARRRPGAQRWESLALPPSLQRAGAFVQSIWQAPNGALWFGTNGLGALRLQRGRIEQFSFRAGSRNTVWAVGAARDSSATWLATFQGIVRVDGDDQITVADALVQGVPLSTTETLAVAGDGVGGLWFATRAQGVLRLGPQGWERLDVADGLGRNYVQAIMADRAGRVWFGTRGGGVTMLDRRPLTPTDLQVSALAYAAEGDQQIDLAGGPLSAAQNDLRFVFSAAIAWLPPDELRFSYRLEHEGRAFAPPQLVESGPAAPIAARSAVLIDLPPGRYRLFIAASAAGLNGPELSLPFTIASAAPSLAVGGVQVRAADSQAIAPGVTMPQLLFEAQQTVVLQLSALDDETAPAQLAYEYRLSEPTSPWQPASGPRLQLSLSPGRYLVELRAVDREGNRSLPVAISLVVPAPLWTTLLIALLVVLLPSTASGLAGALAYRRLARRQALRRAVSGYLIPYDVGPLITVPDRYIGRKHVLDTILGKIANHSFYIYGEKRIGKTSLLLQIRQLLAQRSRLTPAQPLVTVFRNMQQVPAEQFWLYIMRSIAAELPAPPANLACLGQTASYDDLDAEGDLAQIVAALRLGPPAVEPLIVLMLDEIDTLQRYDPSLRQRLRAFCQHTQGHLRVVLAGVLPPAAEPGDTSPWYNIFERVALGPLSELDTLHLIRNYNHNPYRYSPAAEQAVLQASDHKPYLTQWLCSEAVRVMLAERRSQISAADVAQAVATLIAARDGEYAAIWRGLGPAAQAALRGGAAPANLAERDMLIAEGLLVGEGSRLRPAFLFERWFAQK